ncbi:hypothetical protein RMSM_06045, partial [Rhodopirellula maiorica SM1]
MVYKAVGKEDPAPHYGPVVHLVAIADSPTGPFNKYPDPVFTHGKDRFPAEDPYIWYQDGKYRAIVKCMRNQGKNRIAFLAHYDSNNGIHWKEAKYFKISDPSLTWEDGRKQDFAHLERPQVLIENGKPIALMCASDTKDENNVLHSFNVQIPLVVTK